MFVIGYHQNASSQQHTQNLTIEQQNSHELNERQVKVFIIRAQILKEDGNRGGTEARKVGSRRATSLPWSYTEVTTRRRWWRTATTASRI